MLPEISAHFPTMFGYPTQFSRVTSITKSPKISSRGCRICPPIFPQCLDTRHTRQRRSPYLCRNFALALRFQRIFQRVNKLALFSPKRCRTNSFSLFGGWVGRNHCTGPEKPTQTRYVQFSNRERDFPVTANRDLQHFLPSHRLFRIKMKLDSKKKCTNRQISSNCFS